MQVVIVGGGFCGAFVAKKLDKLPDIQTTLVDRNPYYEYAPSLHKVISDEHYLKKLRIPFSDFLQNTKIITDNVIQIEPKKIKTETQEIFFDILVLCPGISYPIFLKDTTNVFKLKNGQDALAITQKIHIANNLLIVGGGKIGIEIAGEIVTKFPEKTLTIVHSKNRLLDRNKADAAYYVMKFLRKRGAKIILNDRIINHKDNIYYTKSGTKIKADLAFWCAGIQWDTSFMKQFPDDVFAKNGALIVNSHLQLHQHPHIFVGGDITNIAEEKTGRKAELHAKIIVKNINYLLKNKHLLNYKQGKSPIVMSLGDWHGILDYKTIIPGVFSIGLLKKAIEWWTLHQLR